METDKATLGDKSFEFPFKLKTSESEVDTILYSRTAKECSMWMLILCRAIDMVNGANPPYDSSPTYLLAT